MSDLTEVDEMDMNERAAIYEDAISRFQKYVRKDDHGLLALDISDAAEIDVDPIVFADLKRSLDETNRKIGIGELRIEDIQFFDLE